MDQDTSADQQRHYSELLRRLTPAQRLRKAAELTATVRLLALAGLRQRHPEADARELQVRLAVRLYGRAEATRLFRSVPPDAV